MIYNLLTTLIKRHFFVVYSDRFSSDTSATHVERYVAKHFLLKPELIVVNDQIHGFKKVADKLKSLENYPIYIELEYSYFEEEIRLIENIDIYAEANIKYTEKLSDIAYLARLYNKSVNVERVQPLNGEGSESLVIYSKIPTLFSEGYLEQDMEEGVLTESEAKMMMDVHLISFVNFIKLLDDIVNHGKTAASLNHLFQTPLEE